VRDERIDEQPVAIVAPQPTRKRPIVAIAAVVGGAALAIASYRLHVKLPSASLATINFETNEPLVLGSTMSEQEMPPPMSDPRDAHPVPQVEGTPLDELYPSLLDWIHPVVETDVVLPESSGGRFGSGRDGIDRPECGRGHCGVDLIGPIGRPIVAAADGIVVRVEHSESGRDGKSGRYIRIQHSDGTYTAYMHLDTIAEGLQVRDHVDGGQQIGTLGASGIRYAAPHCHFTLEIPNDPSTQGDTVDTTYIDPAPYLVRASIARAPDRRHAIKPAF
jgi:murein DD-endopeptidase MepM/ murein hydrolase activator NlpD